MASYQGEEYELVLGHRQLLSLFFVVVVFFAAFFSVGYFVGFGHGETAGPDPTLATAGVPPAAATPDREVRLPDRLLQPVETPGEAPAAQTPPAEAKPSPRETPVERVAAAPPPKPQSQPAAQKAAPKASPTSAPSTPLSQPRPAAAIPATGGTLHLQVAAVRVAQDAQLLSGKLKERGYPTVVSGDNGDGWYRVLVGPFATREEAEGVKGRLNTDGFDTMLRQL